jgi:hypothetical protein
MTTSANHLRQGWAKRITAAEEDAACPTCGMGHSYDDDNSILGSAGCGHCGRTRPYLVRPTRSGVLDTGTKNGGHMGWHTGDEKNRTLLRQTDDGWQAASYAPYSNSDFYDHTAPTQKAAIEGMMGKMAEGTRRKWWPTTKAWHDKLDKTNE